MGESYERVFSDGAARLEFKLHPDGSWQARYEHPGVPAEQLSGDLEADVDGELDRSRLIRFPGLEEWLHSPEVQAYLTQRKGGGSENSGPQTSLL